MELGALSAALTVLSRDNYSTEAAANRSANGSAWAEPAFERDHLALILPLSVLYVIIFVFGVLGNISTCIVIGRNRQMRTATNFYLFSLACSDLLLLTSGLPLELHKIWFPYPYPFNEPVCIIQGRLFPFCGEYYFPGQLLHGSETGSVLFRPRRLAAETSANATVLTILLFTCERYIAIVHPLAKHQARRRGGRLFHRVAKAPVLLSIVWVMALGLAIPQAMQFGIIDQNAGVRGAPDLSECTIKTVVVKHAFLISTVVFFLGPVSVITCLYVRIALKLRQVKRHRIRCTNQGQGQGHVFRILGEWTPIAIRYTDIYRMYRAFL
ncbi:Pyrokinin-1 receptor [Frankliniella fusca]|uniref:Pyrokinin-1 receptor n=1 Tax=Frankliniella fusca TaxID=407009 RepID=A0AAE1HQC2_9NEOP|nr:Pyrokinin-1 receptor [Frankliniella fusca]